MTSTIRLARIGVAGALLALAACGSQPSAGTQTAAAPGSVFAATLSGRDEVPPTNSRSAHGTARVTYDKASHLASWHVEFSSPTGTVTAAHIHGPADPGSNAPVVLNLVPRNVYPVPSPLDGSAKLSDAQAADLMAGKWYVNVHTVNNPNGEIRGQLLAQ